MEHGKLETNVIDPWLLDFKFRDDNSTERSVYEGERMIPGDPEQGMMVVYQEVARRRVALRVPT